LIRENFIHNPIYNECAKELQKIFLSLFDMLDKDEINYDIRIRKDNSVALSLKENKNRNILTLLVCRNHLKIKIYKVCNLNLYSKDDINTSLRNAILDKYYGINKSKNQMSIYLDDSLIKKIEKTSKENNTKFNDFVTEALVDKLHNIFLNQKHKDEFSELLKDSGIYYDNNDYSQGLPDMLRRKVMFFYLVSAYQDDYMENEGSKFTYDKETNKVSGPSNVFNCWDEHININYYAAYGIAELLLRNSLSSLNETGSNHLKFLLQILEESDNNILMLLINGIKFLNGKLTINKDEVVEK
jgi:hypothetical protein